MASQYDLTVIGGGIVASPPRLRSAMPTRA
jgi:hypothetical protein